MLEDIKESILNFITSRIFVLVVIFLAFFGIMMSRIFYLQIINGQNYADSFTMRIKREVSLPGTRGRIFDRNGQVLADNVLSYSVTMEDNGTYKSAREKQSTLNRTVLKVIDIVESHGDNVIGDFGIVYQNGSYAYTQEGRALLRFKADIYGYSSIDDLKPEEYVATADEMIEYLCGKKKFWISPDLYTEEQIKEYKVPTDLTPEQILKLVTIRYAISSNSFKRYVTTTVASDVSDATVAEILENQSNLQGVDIEQSSLRTYADSKYFANIIGYIGKPDQDELDMLKEQNEDYDANDLVGKAGLEQYMETELQGKKGQRTIYVDSVGNVLEVESETQPESGHDLYLTIDKDLQIAAYNILEQRLAGVLVSKIQNIKQYVPGAHSSAMSIVIPIYDVYYALIQNHIIDTSHFTADDATDLERSVQQRFDTQLDDAISRIMAQLQSDSPTAYCDLPSDMKNYMSYIVSDILMGGDQVLMKSAVNTEDATYIAWAKDETISLKEYLEYAISMNWVDVSGLDVKNSYMNSEEIYQVVVDYISSKLATDSNFHTMLYKYVILNDVVTGREVCLLLYDQGILEYDEETVGKLRSGAYSAYSFMMDKIKNLEITPGQLALEPCSAGCVITDPNTGDVLANVSYPGYDNNRLTNTMDSAYYAELNRDLAGPLYSRSTQERTAPGSTFKPISAVAGLEEGVIRSTDIIHATGVFTEAYGSPTCWIYNQYHGSHGNINMVDAIRVSCNYYFYEVGFRLGGGRSTGYSSDRALAALSKYAAMFGFDHTSGMELPESDPKISDSDGIRSAIGQGTHLYTVSQIARYVSTIANRGTVYDLTLLDKLTDSEGNTIEDYSASVYNNIDIADNSWNTIQEGMHQVAENTAAFKDLNLTIAGKTGTAQQSKSHPNHALFMGYAPYESPQIAIAIRIANGYTSANAASMAADIFSYYFDLTDKDELLNGSATTATSAVIND
ncbi:penicillin-binding protein [Clostridiales bacterium AM23-16LB]|nr:penicillin-binding protein [Clostridiales bacterium AM23-16LB]RHR45246.1 penicillin-binding protein [Clostridiaceae bacterium AF18-31LB]RHW04918.1 penicillin-binding protein [Clostridiaceae bacterium OF09-1]